jgi:glutamine synthetase
MLDPGPPRNLNFYELSPKQVADLGVEVLPLSLDKALDALESDKLFEEALGSGLIREFIRIKRNEWRDYHQTVAPWEVNRYLTFY